MLGSASIPALFIFVPPRAHCRGETITAPARAARWGWRDAYFELKTQQTANKQITKSATAQGHDHVQWVRDNYSDVPIVGVMFVADTKTCFSDANPSEGMCVGPLDAIREVGDEFLSTVRAIRGALPIERLSKVNSFIADRQNSLDGIMARIAPHKLK